MSNFKDSIKTKYQNNQWYVSCNKNLFFVMGDTKPEAEGEAYSLWLAHFDAGDYDENETFSVKDLEPVSLKGSINKAIRG
tara:strand:+ start:166 stop:405 length:240 start_codon:yes stop_codon:yes gene_type:complete